MDPSRTGKAHPPTHPPILFLPTHPPILFLPTHPPIQSPQQLVRTAVSSSTSSTHPPTHPPTSTANVNRRKLLIVLRAWGLLAAKTLTKVPGGEGGGKSPTHPPTHPPIHQSKHLSTYSLTHLPTQQEGGMRRRRRREWGQWAVLSHSERGG